jgi:uncharacterized membrane protein
MAVMEAVRSAMEWSSVALETLAVLVILTGTLVAAVRCRLFQTLLSPESPAVVSRFKHQLVSSLLLGLDLLVASDVIHTAAVEPTLNGVATLGLLVVVRITLTWSLIVEAEGRWPWQAGDEPG